MNVYHSLSGATKIYAVFLKSLVLRVFLISLVSCNSMYIALFISAPLPITYIFFLLNSVMILRCLSCFCISVWIRWQLSDCKGFVLNLLVYFGLTKKKMFKCVLKCSHGSNETTIECCFYFRYKIAFRFTQLL